MTGTRLVQYRDQDGKRAVARLDGAADAVRVEGAASTFELARQAIAAQTGLADFARARGSEPVALDAVALRPAIDHPDPAHLTVSGTGLTHLGSAESRDRMHAAEAAGLITDSMRMFRMGLDGGKLGGERGVQPEWFYKGDGSCLVGPDEPLAMPAFALDGGEEPEIAGIYLIDEAGVPRRLGFALGNEFSDHVIERGNYLWLAHSKLRPAALGAELLTGELPARIAGTSRIVRDGATLWEKPFATGEDNMSHAIANLERHHFKYAAFRRPGDVHVHFFGTATLSCADGIEARAGDRFEISADCFSLPLCNPLARSPAEAVTVRPL